MTTTYDVILSDPPWIYTGQQDKWGAAAKFYKPMTDDEVLAMGPYIQSTLAPRGVLFLWVTSPRLDFGIRCIQHWGLTYRGVAFVWVKTGKNGKPWGARGVRPSIVKPLTEFVLSASRVKTGRPMKIGKGGESVAQTIFAPTREHSRKPEEVYERIERLYPGDGVDGGGVRRLEMFSRQSRPGWDAHGDQAGLFDEAINDDDTSASP